MSVTQVADWYSGRRLLTAQFFRLMYDALRSGPITDMPTRHLAAGNVVPESIFQQQVEPVHCGSASVNSNRIDGGTVTIVTDNKWYALYLAREVWLFNREQHAGGRRGRFVCIDLRPTLAAEGGSGRDSGCNTRSLYRTVDIQGNIIDPQTCSQRSDLFDVDSHIMIYEGEPVSPEVTSASGVVSRGSQAHNASTSSYFDRM